MHNIAVIGAGVIGLSAATAIQDRIPSATVTIHSAKLSPELTSNVAAGMWAPYLYQKTDADKILAWSKDTHDEMLRLWKGGQAADAGVCLQFVKSLSEDLDVYVGKNIVFGERPMPEREIEFMSRLFKKKFKTAVNYVSFTCEPNRYLPFLHRKFVQNGGKIVVERIRGFEALSHYDLIVNCTGLEAPALTGDTKMTPIRGTVVRVKAPWQFHSIMEDNIYIILNIDNAVLGTTAQFGDYDTAVREADTKVIHQYCNSLIPSIENSELVRCDVGLRPGRIEVRLETEVQNLNGKRVPIVHNYGHGGCGVTLSYGCALNVVDLVRQALGIPHRSKI